jgi:hypothetical protein
MNHVSQEKGRSMSTEPASASRIDHLSPDDLVTGFSQSRLLRWFLLALAIHAVVIGGFSIGNIRDMLDPEGAKARKEAAVAAAKAAAQAAAPAETAKTETPEAKPADTATTEAGANPPKPQSSIERTVTEASKPDEIPRQPDDLGISIEDTNLK